MALRSVVEVMVVVRVGIVKRVKVGYYPNVLATC